MDSINVTATSSAVGGGGGIPPPRSPKDLHLCGSWEELDEKVQATTLQLPPTVTSSVQATLTSLNEMCLAGLLAEIKKDEEVAYLNYHRYLTTYIILSEKEDYRNEMQKFDENVDLIAKMVENLKQSLIKRYDLHKIKNSKSEPEIRQILEQHRKNMNSEIEAGAVLKQAREDLGSLRMVKQLLEEDFQQQQQQEGNSGRRASLQGQQASADNDNVPEQLKCPVCFEIFQSEVLQCRNGHSICSSCYNDPKIIDCPECRVMFGGGVVRNRALEGLVSTWRVECPFREQGCSQKILIKDMTQHVEGCDFGKSDERRQIIRKEMEIKEKEEEIRRLQDIHIEAIGRCKQSEEEWRKLEGNKLHGDILEKVVQELKLIRRNQGNVGC